MAPTQGEDFAREVPQPEGMTLHHHVFKRAAPKRHGRRRVQPREEAARADLQGALEQER